MNKDREQFLLYKKRIEIKQSIEDFDTDKQKRIDYIKRFIKKTKKIIGLAIFFIIIQGLIEASLFFAIKNISSDYLLFILGYRLTMPMIVLSIACFYIGGLFLSIKYERLLVLTFINKLRADLFATFFDKNIAEADYENRAGFFTKISYSLSLVSMGLDNSIVGFVYFILSFSILTIIALFLGLEFLLYIPIILFGSLAFMMASYLVSKYLISKEVSSYSAIFKHISRSIFDFDSLKNFSEFKKINEKLKNIVNVDTFFRIRRDVWLRFSGRAATIVFAIVLSIFFLLSKNKKIDISAVSQNLSLLKGFFYLYMLRIFYLSIRVGLYYIPLKLGLRSCIPKYGIKKLEPFNKDWGKISFRSNKVKIHEHGNYFKKISIDFNKKERILFFGEKFAGKTSLARLFSGNGFFSRHSWVVKIDKIRFTYNNWSDIFQSKYFFVPKFSSSKTIGEIILNKDKEDINTQDIDKIVNLIEQYPLLKPLLSGKKFSGENLYTLIDNQTLLFTAQIAYCLLNKPSIIIIDNIWIDINYKEIKEMISYLDKNLKDSTIILFARNNNNLLAYTSIFEIKNENIKKI